MLDCSVGTLLEIYPDEVHCTVLYDGYRRKDATRDVLLTKLSIPPS